MEYILNLDVQGLEHALRTKSLDPLHVQPRTGLGLVHLVACIDPWHFAGDADAQDMCALEWVDDQCEHMLYILKKYGAPFNMRDDHGDLPIDIVHVDMGESVKSMFREQCSQITSS